MTEATSDALRRGDEALNCGEVSEVLALLDPEIEWDAGERGPHAGVHRGRESFEGFLRSWLDAFEAFRVEPLEVIERGDSLIAVVRQSGQGQGSGVAVTIEIAHVWTIRAGRAIRWQSFPNRELALAALERR